MFKQICKWGSLVAAAALPVLAIPGCDLVTGLLGGVMGGGA
jgi:hypothetical protein